MCMFSLTLKFMPEEGKKQLARYISKETGNCWEKINMYVEQTSKKLTK